MSSLFELFDPTYSRNICMGLMASMIILPMIPKSPFLIPSQAQITLKKISSLVNTEFKTILGMFSAPASTWFIVGLFWFIFFNNFMSLFPHIPAATQYIVFTLKLALPIWLGHMLYSWMIQPEPMFAHLVPTGTPVALWSFMVIIELISSVIRPLTLSIRLMANITGGHVMLGLISSYASVLPGSEITNTAILSALTIFMMLEIAVALIQAYVFTLLSTLYLEEVQTKKIMTNPLNK